MTSRIQIIQKYPLVISDTSGNILDIKIFDNYKEARLYLYDTIENEAIAGEGKIYKAHKNKRFGTLVNFKKLDVIETARPFLTERKNVMKTDIEAINQKIKKEGLEV